MHRTEDGAGGVLQGKSVSALKERGRTRGDGDCLMGMLLSFVLSLQVDDDNCPGRRQTTYESLHSVVILHLRFNSPPQLS
jgi:hypothetical protein